MRCERMSLEKFETWSANQTRVADQKPLACSAFLSSRGGRVGAVWTMSVDLRKACRRRAAGCQLHALVSDGRSSATGCGLACETVSQDQG
jgi:hypothetical protein